MPLEDAVTAASAGTRETRRTRVDDEKVLLLLLVDMPYPSQEEAGHRVLQKPSISLGFLHATTVVGGLGGCNAGRMWAHTSSPMTAINVRSLKFAVLADMADRFEG